MHPTPLASAKAGLAYGLIVFAIGFALGAIRVLAVAPRVGATAAVTLEAPIMLAASWKTATFCIARFGVAATIRVRIAMGLVAFATLTAGELGLSLLAFGRPLADFLQGYATLPGLIGLAAQVAFAMIPLIRLAAAERR